MSVQPPHPVLVEYYARDEDRRTFVIGLFDATAAHYDYLCRAMSLGSGQWYRRQALARLGLCRGMRLLDVATGTGPVNRAAAGILGDPRAVVGLDPSAGMLREARTSSPARSFKDKSRSCRFTMRASMPSRSAMPYGTRRTSTSRSASVGGFSSPVGGFSFWKSRSHHWLGGAA